MKLDDQQRRQRQHPEEPAPWSRKESAPFEGPRSPQVEKPNTNELIKRMKSVDRDKAKRYRQRSGQSL